MTIAIVTTQGITGSTVIGRALPLARQFARANQAHLILLNGTKKLPVSTENLKFHSVGQEPLKRTRSGKKRLKGPALVFVMAATVVRIFFQLIKIRPEVVIIMKSLPHNVAGVYLWRYTFGWRKKIILDVDDFELTANVLSSIWQRATIHWAERAGLKISNRIVVATPFLADHFKQLMVSRPKPITMIPTGLEAILSLPLQKNPPTHLLYLGSLSISSGHRVDMLPEILQKVHQIFPHTKLIIAGHGDDQEILQKKIANMNLSPFIVWYGRFNADDVATLLADAAVIIDPIDASITARAKSSFRTVLAAAAGLPVVTSNIGIRPYFLPPELHKAFFARPTNAEDYASKIIKLLSNPLTEQQRRSLQTYAKTFTWPVLAQKYQQFFSEI